MKSLEMKNIIRIIIGFQLVMLMGCSDDFLNQPPRASLSVGSFPTSETDAIQATNAVYNSLRAWHINTGGFPLLDIMADDAEKGSNPGDGNVIAVYDRFEHQVTEGSVERWYKALYEAIKRANLGINEIPKIDMDVDLQNRLIAETRFLRAYYYGLLIRGFGDVPKVTVTDPPIDLGRTSVDEILTDIIYPDLEYAIVTLPTKSDYANEDLGRITSGAAQAFMARIKLFYGDFQAVESLCKDIIESNEYALVTNYEDIFPAYNEHNSESIFEISSTVGNFEEGGNQYANTQGVRGTPNRGWGFCRPTYALITEMTNTQDLRLDPSVLFLNEIIDGIVIGGEGPTPDTTYTNGQITSIECYNQKVWTPGTDAETSWSHNRRIIRYSDVLLMYAEALNENGKTAEALPFLNEIRNRAGLSTVNETNQTTVRDIILKERKYEFALEGLRFWDLVRTSTADSVLGPLGFIKNKNELFPIPQSEIDISQGRITQNQGY